MENVIEAAGLSKVYGRTRALDGLDLGVGAGEVHGFLGPNGAGKSTTLRILLGLARADGGRVRLLGGDPWADAVALHRRVAYVPGDVAVWPSLSGGESIDLLTRLRGANPRDAAVSRERERLLEAFDFRPRVKGRAYSKGNRQKVALIAAFATPAEVYLFDEPTSGLDPLMERVFQAEVERVHAEGATVFLSSHLLGEVERLCDRVSIVRDGRVVESGTLAQLRHLSTTQVSFDGPRVPELPELAGLPGSPASSGSPGAPGAIEVSHEGDRVVLRLDAQHVATVLPALAAARVTGLRIEPTSLEELFLRHYDTAAGVGEGAAAGAAPGRAGHGRHASGPGGE